MRYPAGQKEQTRKKIVEAAGKVFRRDGYHASGVDKVMQEAGLTAGAFYAHFASKQALLAAALPDAGAELRQRVEKHLHGLSGHAWARGFLGLYFGQEHCEGSEAGCPLVALASEVSRADEAVKASFEGLICDLQQMLVSNTGSDTNIAGEPNTGSDTNIAGELALAVLSICVGGVALARSVKNRALAERIVDSCRRQAEKILCSDALLIKENSDG